MGWDVSWARAGQRGAQHGAAVLQAARVWGGRGRWAGSPGCAGPCPCSSPALWWSAARAWPHVMMNHSGTSGNSSVLAALSCVPPELQPRGSARHRGPWRLLRLGESGCCSSCSLVPPACRAGRTGWAKLPALAPTREGCSPEPSSVGTAPAGMGQGWLCERRDLRRDLAPAAWGRAAEARGRAGPSPLALGGCWGLARPRPGFGTEEFLGSPELSQGLLVGARPLLRPPSLAVRWRAAGQSLAHAQPFCRHLHTLDRSV